MATDEVMVLVTDMVNETDTAALMDTVNVMEITITTYKERMAALAVADSI